MSQFKIHNDADVNRDLRRRRGPFLAAYPPGNSAGTSPTLVVEARDQVGGRCSPSADSVCRYSSRIGAEVIMDAPPEIWKLLIARVPQKKKKEKTTE